MNKKVEEKRIEWIDVLKSLAICCVILVHATENVYTFDLESMQSLPVHTRIFAFVLFSIGRIGVPIFMMVTGYLLLDRVFDEKKCVRFWKRNLFGLFLTTEIWIVIYNIFLINFDGREIKGIEFFENMIFLKYLNVPHMWYMPMIMGVYVFLPFVAMALHKIRPGLLRFPMILAIAYIFVLPVINVFVQAAGEDPLLTLPSLNFSGGIYGIMLVLGYLIKKGCFKKINGIVLVLAGAASFICAIAMQLYAYNQEYVYNLWYDNIFLLITVFCLVEFVSRQRKVLLPGVFCNLAKCSFGIYLVHYIVVIVAMEYLKMESASKRIAVIWCLTFVISWAVVWLVSRCKAAGRILFFIR